MSCPLDRTQMQNEISNWFILTATKLINLNFNLQSGHWFVNADHVSIQLKQNLQCQTAKERIEISIKQSAILLEKSRENRSSICISEYSNSEWKSRPSNTWYFLEKMFHKGKYKFWMEKSSFSHTKHGNFHLNWALRHELHPLRLSGSSRIDRLYLHGKAFR